MGFVWIDYTVCKLQDQLFQCGFFCNNLLLVQELSGKSLQRRYRIGLVITFSTLSVCNHFYAFFLDPFAGWLMIQLILIS